MKFLIFIAALFVISITDVNAQGRKCVGSSSCSACTTCSGCQHCAKSGGTCGVCSSTKHVPPTTLKKKAPAIEKKSVPVGNSPTSPSATETKLKPIYIVTATTLNLRSGPGESNSIIVPLDLGTELIALTSNSTWWKVQVVNTGVIGYVHSSYIKRKP